VIVLYHGEKQGTFRWDDDPFCTRMASLLW